ncbi:MAG TPA: hypothetical protein VIP53_02835 [Nitrososphaera sp.]
MTSRKKASKNNSNNNNMLIIPIAVGLLTILVGMPATMSFSQQQPDTATITTITTTTNDTTAADNATQLGNTTNQTTTTTTAPDNETLLAQQEQEQLAALASSLRENLTAGESKVLILTRADTDLPSEQEQRDIDPLGLVEFPDQRSMTIERPEYASSNEDGVATLYAGGPLSFQFGNITGMEPADNIDVLFISTDGIERHIGGVIDDTGEDNEFTIPTGLRNGQTYYVLVTLEWPDLDEDTVMGILGKAVNLEEEPATTGNMTTTGNTTAGG